MAPIIDLHDDERNIVPWKWFHGWITMISMTTKETKCQSAMKVISLLNNNDLHDNVRNKVPWKWFHYWITKNWIPTKCLQAHNFGLTGQIEWTVTTPDLGEISLFRADVYRTFSMKRNNSIIQNKKNSVSPRCYAYRFLTHPNIGFERLADRILLYCVTPTWGIEKLISHHSFQLWMMKNLHKDLFFCCIPIINIWNLWEIESQEAQISSLR